MPPHHIQKIWVEPDAFLVVINSGALDCDNLEQWGQWQKKQRYICENHQLALGHTVLKYADNQLRKWHLPERLWRAAGIDPQWQAVTGIDFEPPASLPVRFMATSCKRKIGIFPSEQTIYEGAIDGLVLIARLMGNPDAQ